MELNRQSIERRDFPLARRGYDKAAVDTHLRELAAAVEELAQRKPTAGDSFAAAASGQVQGILNAAEESARSIMQRASADASQLRDQAESDAASSRERALAQGDAYVQRVAQLATELHERIEAMDREMTDLITGLGEGVGRLLADLRSADAKMRESYEQATAGSDSKAPDAGARLTGSEAAAPATSERQRPSAPAAEEQKQSTDVDGARLVALNMALSGDSREKTDRYLAEKFDLPDRKQLLDEVYAAADGR